MKRRFTVGGAILTLALSTLFAGCKRSPYEPPEDEDFQSESSVVRVPGEAGLAVTHDVLRTGSGETTGRGSVASASARG